MDHMRRLYIGLSGPIGYDYRKHGAHEANPVLEDVNGLLLCYDELIFLSRGLCPVDLRDLEYVHFVTDTSDALERALIALEQSSELLEPGLQFGSYYFPQWSQVLGRLTGGRQKAIDNHSRPLLDITSPEALAGNAANFENAVMDVCMAGSLEMADLDVLTNSVASRAVDQALAELEVERQFSDWHIDVAQELATIRVPNVWSPEGVYHPSIEDLRHDDRVSDFRRYLAEQSPDGTATERAAEISALAESHARKMFVKSFERPNVYTTVGRAAIGPVGNAIAAPFGTVASAAVRTLDWAAKRRRDERLRWAAFVVQLRESTL